MKFEIEITEEDLKKLKEGLVDSGLSPKIGKKRVIKELFWLQVQYDSVDIRGKVKVKEVK